MEEQIYETIVVAAEHAQLKKVHDVFAVEDTVNALFCQFEFRSDEWDDMTKTAVFIHEDHHCHTSSVSDSDAIHVLLDSTNKCAVPSEILEEHGSFSVGVFGVNGDAILPTNLLRFKCNIGCYSDGTEPEEPTQSIYEQILAGLSTKQNTLIAGDNITIVGNKISANTPTDFRDKHYVHIQSSAESVWNITHNLNKYPAVSIVDSAGTAVVGDVAYINENELKVSFMGAFSGKAFMN